MLFWGQTSCAVADTLSPRLWLFLGHVRAAKVAPKRGITDRDLQSIFEPTVPRVVVNERNKWHSHLLLFQVCERLSKSRASTHLSARLPHLAYCLAPAASWLHSLQQRWIWAIFLQLSCTDPTTTHCDCHASSIFVIVVQSCTRLVEKNNFMRSLITCNPSDLPLAEPVASLLIGICYSLYIVTTFKNVKSLNWKRFLDVSLACNTTFRHDRAKNLIKANSKAQFLSESQKRGWTCTHQVALVGGCFHWDKGRGWEEPLK